MQNGDGLVSTDKTAELFQYTSSKDPLSRSLPVSIETDSGAELGSFLLQIQKDQYLFSDDYPEILTNRDVESYWQKYLCRKNVLTNRPQPAILFADQLNSEGEAQPFSSLFFCQAKQEFFSPICPACGDELQLCVDDELLVQADLESYSGSLQRYLFCPICHEKSVERAFYVLHKEEGDRDLLQGLEELIAAWQNLLARPEKNEHFPCDNCAGRKACYGTNLLAKENIRPFAFYPFFLSFEIKTAELKREAEATVEEIIPELSSPEQDNSQPDSELATMLENIAARWESEQQGREQVPVKEEKPPELSEVEQQTVDPDEKTVVFEELGLDQSCDQEETVILRSDLSKINPSGGRCVNPADDATVLFNNEVADPGEQSSAHSGKNLIEEVFAKQTMSNQLRAVRKTEKSEITLVPGMAEADKTIPFKQHYPIEADKTLPGSPAPETNASFTSPVTDDDLAETVILKPGKQKD